MQKLKKLVIIKEWSGRLVVKNKFGDRETYKKIDLEHLLKKGKFKLAESKERKQLSVTLRKILILLFGGFFGKFLFNRLQKIIEQKAAI